MFCAEIHDYLNRNYQGRCIGVEFKHGSHCKKAIGILEDIGPNFIRLVSKPDYWPFIKVKIYSVSNPPYEEWTTEIIILKRYIVAVELDPYEYCVENKPEKMESDAVQDINSEEDKTVIGPLEETCSYQNKKDVSKAEETEPEKMESDVVQDINLEEEKKVIGSSEGNSLIKCQTGELVLKSVVPVNDDYKEDDRIEEDTEAIYYEEKGTCEDE